MSGHANPARDQHGIYRAAVTELADELGWKRTDVWRHFEWLAACREFEQRLPRAYAEYLALEDVRAVYDKRGCTEPS